MCMLIFTCMQGSWKQSLRNSFKNFRRDRPVDENGRPVSKRAQDDEAQGPPSKRLKVAFTDEDTIHDEDTYEEAVQDLKSEWRKGRKSHSQAK